VRSAKVRQRGCSRPLQRVVSDFGADQPFAQVMDKLVEHYGIVLAESTIRRITEGHAEKIFAAAARDPLIWPEQRGRSAVLVVEMDGGMVPTVEPDPTTADQRKGKKLQWQEAKLCLAHAQGSAALVYGGALQGDVVAAGQQLLACARQAGFGRGTQVHPAARWCPLDRRSGRRPVWGARQLLARLLPRVRVLGGGGNSDRDRAGRTEKPAQEAAWRGTDRAPPAAT
jgi:hypothetical protein